MEPVMKRILLALGLTATGCMYGQMPECVRDRERMYQGERFIEAGVRNMDLWLETLASFENEILRERRYENNSASYDCLRAETLIGDAPAEVWNNPDFSSLAISIQSLCQRI